MAELSGADIGDNPDAALSSLAAALSAKLGSRARAVCAAQQLRADPSSLTAQIWRDLEYRVAQLTADGNNDFGGG